MENSGEQIQITNNHIADLTLEDVPYHNVEVDISVTGQDLVDYYNTYPNLPGIMITENGEFHSLLSRKKFFEHLSRPFGVEVYLKRPVEYLLEHMNPQTLMFSCDYMISQTVQEALSRNLDNIYEPIIVVRNGKYTVVDMYTLLLFMTRSLDNANQIISKQFQIAHQLNEDIEFEDVFHSILSKTSSIISFDEGIVIRDIVNSSSFVAHKGSMNDRDIEQFISYYKERLSRSLEYKDGTTSCIINFGIPLSLGNKEITLKVSSLIVPLSYSEFNLGAIILLRFAKNDNYYSLTDLPKNEGIPEPFIPFQKLDEILFANLESTFSSAIRNTQLISQVQELAVTDTLTNIMNRRGFYSEANKDFEKIKLKNDSLCILIIDIDHFKSVNDIYGHVMGDDVIRVVVKEIKSCLRETDLLGRYGGDEFIVLLPNSNLTIAKRVAARILRCISALMVESTRGDILVTASIGIGSLDPDLDELDTLIQKADEALLMAKRLGRNQTIAFDKGTFYNNGFPIATSLIEDEEKTEDRLTLSNGKPLNGIGEAALEQTIDDLIEGYVHALELRDKETEGHTQRVARMTVDLALKLDVEPSSLVNIRRGALLHDIGKIAIPDQILLKPGPLNEKEWEIMRKHPIYAYDLLSTNPFLRTCLEIPYNHHERWDGDGYPRKIKGYQIPMAARIFSIVDVWDALISHRTYRAAWSCEDALAYIKDQAGKQFDPQIVPLFLELINKNYL